jgi:hypothetical protein
MLGSKPMAFAHTLPLSYTLSANLHFSSPGIFKALFNLETTALVK